MKLAAFMAVMMVLLTGCKNDSGGGPSSDDDVLSLIKQANGALLGVRDAESAKAAKPTIQQLTVRLREAAAKSKKAGKTGPPANEDDRTAAAAQELTGNALRVKGNPATNDVIGADLDAFMNVMAGNG